MRRLMLRKSTSVGFTALREYLFLALSHGAHPISLTLAGLAGMLTELEDHFKSAPPSDEPARQLAMATLALARRDATSALRCMRAAHRVGLHYTNIGNELLALTADYAGLPLQALPLWRRLADKPSLIWREVAHNWPGLIRLARRRVALLATR